MVHKYKRKRDAAAYSDETLRQAVLEFQNSEQKNLSALSKKYGIPRTTLQYWREKELPNVHSKGRFKPVFNLEMEQELREHIVTLQKMFYGMSPVDIRRLAFQFAVANKIPHPFNTERKIAGKDWLRSFMEKNSLSLRTPEATSMARVAGFTKTKVTRFFALLKDVLEKHHFPPDRIFNVDETGISCVQKPRKVVAVKGIKQLGRITSAERGKNITLLGTISAGGTFIPPMLIYPRTRMNPQLLVGSFPGTVAFANPSGWSDANLFVEYIKHLIKCVRPTKERPILLLLDGHGSHKSLEAINLCRDTGIIMLTFPPHTSNRLQPLDIGVFGPFKTYLANEMDNYMTNHPGERITEYVLGPIIKEAFMGAFSSKNIIKSFEKSGITPYNPNVFDESDFIGASAVLSYSVTIDHDLAMPGSSGATKSVPSDQNSDINSDFLLEIAVNNGATDVLDSNKSLSDIDNETNQINLNAPSTSRVPVTPQPKSSSKPKATDVLDSNRSLSDIDNETNQMDLNAPSTSRVPLTDISPLPQPKSSSKSKARKQEKSEILTNTPYKDELEDKLINKEDKSKREKLKRKIGGETCTTKKKNKEKKKQKTTTPVEGEDSETLCLYCNGLYGESQEEWIQCDMCKEWAHEDCTDYAGEARVFVCDVCRK